MKKLACILLLSAAPFVISQRAKPEDLNVYVTRSSSLFASNVSDLDHMDFRNSRAVYIDPDGRRGEWQALHRGKGKTEYVSHDGVYGGGTAVQLMWWHSLDSEHMVVQYDWIQWFGSSSQSSLVQVFELRDSRVFITQQIEADTHGGGTIAGAWFDQKKKRLTVKAVEPDSPKGRCCPTHINIVVFQWEGGKFRQVSVAQLPMPTDKFGRKNRPIADHGILP